MPGPAAAGQLIPTAHCLRIYQYASIAPHRIHLVLPLTRSPNAAMLLQSKSVFFFSGVGI